MKNYGTLPGTFPSAPKAACSCSQERKFGYKPIDVSVNSLPAREVKTTVKQDK